MIDASTVHTTGVNVEGVLANVASLTVIIGAAGAVITRSLKRSITDNTKAVIEDVIAKEVTPRFLEIHTDLADLRATSNLHSTAIARLQGIQEGKRQVVAEASLKSNNE